MEIKTERIENLPPLEIFKDIPNSQNKYNWSYEAKKLINVYKFLMNKYH